VELVNESYKVFEEIDLNGKTVNLYERVEKLNICGAEGDDRKEIWTKRYWITDDALLLRTEFDNENIKTKSITRSTTVYEYNPNIKIEAPVK